MRFIVTGNFKDKPSTPTDTAYLIIDNWDDFGYKTAFSLEYVDEKGDRFEIGWVKIAKFGIESPARICDDLDEIFDRLDDSYFSLGQSQDYYAAINQLDEGTRRKILTGLRDIAYDNTLLQRALREDVTNTSLLRQTSLVTVSGQFSRLAHGKATLSAFNFQFHRTFDPNSEDVPPPLEFCVIPHSQPPTNVHVLIGRNGVGKSHCFYSMAMTIIGSSQSPDRGKFVEKNTENPDEVFANLIFVSFSLFDTALVYQIESNRDPKTRMNFEFIGFNVPPEIPATEIAPRVIEHRFADQFAEALATCKSKNSLDRWKRTMKILESDPRLSELGFQDLNPLEDESWLIKAKETFKGLSSGHKIICLTMTQLVARVAERSLILIDEPESHLHPPLLSAYLRALSDLLIEQNGVAIIATHSPVVLQEVPSHCVWILDQSGETRTAVRPKSETFGENVSTLTRDVFWLEVSKSGYLSLLQKAIKELKTYDAVSEHFGGRLGSEARAILRGLTESESK